MTKKITTKNRRKQKKSKKNKNYKHKLNISNKYKGGGLLMSYYNKEDDNTINKNNIGVRCMAMDYNITNGKIIFSNSRCKMNSIPNSQFCETHRDYSKILKSLTSGYEPRNKKKWMSPDVESSHNCYSYFLDDVKDVLKKKCLDMCKNKNKNADECPKKLEECGDFKPQPGDYYYYMSGDETFKPSMRKYTCDDMINKIMRDNPSLIETTPTDRCATGYYKGAIVVHPNKTFHFYRQDSDGYWSHKPGTLPVSKVDADSAKIVFPHYANRTYEKGNKNNEINYTNFCGYFCIPTNNKKNTNSK